eukprot:gene5640-9456_t
MDTIKLEEVEELEIDTSDLQKEPFLPYESMKTKFVQRVLPFFVVILFLLISASFLTLAVIILLNSEEIPVSFILMGDFGVHGAPQQRLVAKEMSQWCLKNKCDFILTTGDNFYDNGVKSIYDEQWKSTFLDVYNQSSLERIKWYSLLGNHDYRGNPQSQIDYTHVQKRWTMPDFYYKFSHSQDNSISTTKAHFLVMDTTAMVDNRNSSSINHTALNSQNSTLQYAWIDQTLSQLPLMDWKFVVGHHPVYDLKHHVERSPEIIENVLPRISDRVHGYFSGHVHAMRVLEDDKTNIIHLISGAGGRDIDKPTKHPFDKYTLEKPGFMIVELFSKRMKVRVFNAESGKVENVFEKQK